MTPSDVTEQAKARFFPIMLYHEGGYYRDGTTDLARKAGTPFVVVCVPWAMLEPHADQAQKNHSQSLERLAQRGGLSAAEALDVLDGRRWSSNSMTVVDANAELCRRVLAWEARE